MGKIAFSVSGQGSQKLGVGADLREAAAHLDEEETVAAESPERLEELASSRPEAVRR